MVTGADIVNTAEHYSGVKYFEGNPQSTANGFDCSGLVQRVMSDLKMSISRTTSTQLADAIAQRKVIGTDLSQALQGDILHYTGHEEIWIGPVAGGPGKVFSEATPGTTAAVRDRTPWPIIGIVRYADGGPGPKVGSIGQIVPGQPGGTLNSPQGPGQESDPGKVSGGLVDLIPGLSGVISFVGAIVKFVQDVTNPNFWERVAVAFLGVILLALGLYGIAHKANVITVTSSMVKKGADIASQS